MKQIAVLGSTGSIGTQALDVIAQSNGAFRAAAICADKNASVLAQQANLFRPEMVGICDKEKFKELKSALSYSPEITAGQDAAQLCAALPCVDIAVNGISGISGFLPFVAAIKAGKTIAAANKESIVCAHSILDELKTDKAAPLTASFSNGARIIPVDSEQSAIFQCLEEKKNVKSLILTASGGAFRELSYEQLENVTAKDALSHPTWSMGNKITIDSATLFNKGLEIMEAAFLFGFSADEIEVYIHPQSIVHSMVRFFDGSIKAQLSVPDMRGAIQYAMTYPARIKSPVAELDITEKPLTFFAPDTKKYPAIELAYAALREGRVLPVVYNAANEIAAEKFANNECSFHDIATIVEYAMTKANTDVKSASVCDIMEIDAQARQLALCAAKDLHP